MRLTDLRIPGREGVWSLRIEDGKIKTLKPAGHAPAPAGSLTAAPGEPAPASLSFDGALAFPGLINSHDHLDFNLFPALGHDRYTNYRRWGWDIHSKNAADIKAVLKVPQPLRILWGIYKNLLNGFTTVVNHGVPLNTNGAPITVFQQSHNLHSIGFEPNWRWKLNRPARQSWPYVLHVGEGTDEAAYREITNLLRWNLFKKPLIGIHGVAMTEEQAAGFRALVWCPASNYFLLDRTAPIQRLKTRIPIVFGTDSTLTAPWDCWSQIRLARKEQAATDEELFQMLTVTPAAVWGLTDRGMLAEGMLADLVIAKPGILPEDTAGPTTMDAFYDLTLDNILLVIHHGKVVLFDASLKETLQNANAIEGLFQQAGENGKYVPGDINGLMQRIKEYYPEVQFPID